MGAVSPGSNQLSPRIVNDPFVLPQEKCNHRRYFA
jgi:hypothetical protein